MLGDDTCCQVPLLPCAHVVQFVTEACLVPVGCRFDTVSRWVPVCLIWTSPATDPVGLNSLNSLSSCVHYKLERGKRRCSHGRATAVMLDVSPLFVAPSVRLCRDLRRKWGLTLGAHGCDRVSCLAWLPRLCVSDCLCRQASLQRLSRQPPRPGSLFLCRLVTMVLMVSQDFLALSVPAIVPLSAPAPRRAYKCRRCEATSQCLLVRCLVGFIYSPVHRFVVTDSHRALRLARLLHSYLT